MKQDFYQHLVETLPDLITVVDSELKILFASDSYQKLLGQAPSGLMGQDLLETIHSRDQAALEVVCKRILKNPEATASLEFRQKTADGRWVAMEAQLSNQSLKESIGGIVIAARSTSQRDGLLKYERLVTMGEIAAGMAHEVRNPIAIIASAAYMVKEQFEAEDQVSKDMTEILAQVDRLRGLVKDVLEFSISRPEDAIPVDLQQSLRESLLAARQRYGASDQLTSTISKSKDKLMVMGHPLRLQQVFTNLFLNAFQSSEGSGQVKVTHRLDGGKVFITFQDDGPGIATNSLPRIFEPFFSTRTQGSGLGLALARKIVEEHKGRLSCLSSDKGNCVFEVMIPQAGDES